jgi:hypothetical protein
MLDLTIDKLNAYNFLEVSFLCIVQGKAWGGGLYQSKGPTR